MPNCLGCSTCTVVFCKHKTKDKYFECEYFTGIKIYKDSKEYRAVRYKGSTVVSIGVGKDEMSALIGMLKRENNIRTRNKFNFKK